VKILIIDTYYPNFLKSFRCKYPDLYRQSYNKQLQLLLKQSFGTADFYSFNLKKLGHQAEDVVVNDEILQQRLAFEENIKVSRVSYLSKIQMFPFIHRYIGRPKWVQEIALEQIKRAKADIVYVQDLSILNPETLLEVKKYCHLLVGQIACPLPSAINLKCFDLILTSFPHYVDYLKKSGIKSEYFKLAFEPRVLKRVGKRERTYDVSFVGSFSYFHRSGTRLLEDVAKKIPINIWGQGLNMYYFFSPLRKNYHGEIWGLSMYEILAQSKIVINRHISVARDDANNMRLYESTGMGAMLITDEKKNISELFEVGKEVETYKGASDLLEKIQYYLTHEKEREKIAKAGQLRTLNEYNYYIRMKELVKILQKYL